MLSRLQYQSVWRTFSHLLQWAARGSGAIDRQIPSMSPPHLYIRQSLIKPKRLYSGIIGSPRKVNTLSVHLLNGWMESLLLTQKLWDIGFYERCLRCYFTRPFTILSLDVGMLQSAQIWRRTASARWLSYLPLTWSGGDFTVLANKWALQTKWFSNWSKCIFNHTDNKVKKYILALIKVMLNSSKGLNSLNMH